MLNLEGLKKQLIGDNAGLYKDILSIIEILSKYQPCKVATILQAVSEIYLSSAMKANELIKSMKETKLTGKEEWQ